MTALEPRISDAYTNDREHVFHSWSAQGALDPVVIAGALVIIGLGLMAGIVKTRQKDPS